MLSVQKLIFPSIHCNYAVLIKYEFYLQINMFQLQPMTYFILQWM
jgi:hypothetical protein